MTPVRPVPTPASPPHHAPTPARRPHRLLVLLVGLVLVASCGGGATSIAVPDDRPGAGTFRGGPTRPGRTTALGDLPDGPATAWTVTATGPVIASPVATDDVIVVPLGDGKLAAVEVADGTERWRVDIPDADASATLVGDHALVASLDGTLSAHALEDGAVAWTVDLGGRVRSSPLVVDDVVVVGVGDRLVARVVADGSARWEATLGGRIDGSAASVGDRVVVGDTANGVWAVDADTGEIAIEVKLGPVVDATFVPGIAATPAVTDDLVVLGSTNGRVSGLDVADLASRWSVELDGGVYASVALAEDGTTGWVADDTGTVTALDLADGAVGWSTDVGESVYASPVLAGGPDPTLLVVEEGGSLVGLAPGDGRQRWRADVGKDGNYMASTPIVVDGTVVVGTNTGDVMGLR